MRILPILAATLTLSPVRAAPAAWASSQVEGLDESDPWFISAPTQQMADALSQGAAVKGERLKRYYPTLKLAESCEPKIQLTTNFLGGVMSRDPIKFKGRDAYRTISKKAPRGRTPGSRCVLLAVTAKVGTGDLLELDYCLQDTCPKAIRSDFAKILDSLNPKKPAAPLK